MSAITVPMPSSPEKILVALSQLSQKYKKMTPRAEHATIMIHPLDNGGLQNDTLSVPQVSRVGVTAHTIPSDVSVHHPTHGYLKGCIETTSGKYEITEAPSNTLKGPSCGNPECCEGSAQLDGDRELEMGLHEAGTRIPDAWYEAFQNIGP